MHTRAEVSISKIIKGLLTPFLQFSHVDYRVLDDSYAQGRALICAQRFLRGPRSHPEDPKDPYLCTTFVPHYFISPPKTGRLQQVSLGKINVTLSCDNNLPTN